jgi:hypothetical protein
MRVSELGTYRSADYPDKTMNDVHAMMQEQESNPGFTQYMDQVREDIGDRGLQFPVQVDRATRTYGNGHHRFHDAVQRGLRHLPVTENVRESTGPGDGWNFP